MGRVLGVRLARAGARVTFMARRPLPDPVAIERVDGGERMELAAPAHATEMPADTGVVLVCLPREALDDALLEKLQGATVPVVWLMPLLPRTWKVIEGALGDRAVAAMLGVTAYVRQDDVVRYWLPRGAPTTFERKDGMDALLAAFERAGLPSEMAERVLGSNQAVTATFLPMAMALAHKHTIDAALGDADLLDLTLRAMDESAAYARTLGDAPEWVSLLAKFIGPRMLKIGVGLAERGAPEALHYVEEHFGTSRVRSTQMLGAELAQLCTDAGFQAGAISELASKNP